jgi:hypothetical protein
MASGLNVYFGFTGELESSLLKSTKNGVNKMHHSTLPDQCNIKNRDLKLLSSVHSQLTGMYAPV